MEATARDDDEGPDWPLLEGPPPPGVHGNATSPATVARILEMRREGLPYSTVSERLGVDDNTIWRYARAAGLVLSRVCVSCGRSLPGRRPPKESRPVVCACCRPKWRTKLVFRRRADP
jgi:hypothetical protein